MLGVPAGQCQGNVRVMSAIPAEPGGAGNVEERLQPFTEGLMRHLLLSLSLVLIASCFVSNGAHAQGYGPPPGYYAPGQPLPPPPPPYAGRPGPYGGGPAYSAENCGTPDEPKPCPPMPRVPLPYYPANRP